ncbi:MAG: GAF domain-containing protein [Phycisphaerales bacterium]|nr:GAF domain-containing protein [Phycisphaerales bacterium]
MSNDPAAPARRNYKPLHDLPLKRGTREETMRTFVDAVWEAFRNAGVSWVGFYTTQGDEMWLGPRRDKPACSPIGMHGACGQAVTRRQALVIHDVRRLGEAYVACDPRDMAELVIPLFENDQCWGVLDVDSFDVNAFSTRDAAEMTELLLNAGLTDRSAENVEI